ncbi:hypothetical protein KILIM_026_00850 [Kineosphaera limosa NBRC 100340]|uniref:Glutaredoxin n=1 Tax=Kineosphaera limosa NBRC 100340 TaxID=1184609 RepID=K6XAJ6_9MICO|nr:glutaredoxin family protein [Kineosphaera limosa]GAB95814.1 hypothetical protein KILIM_026_00850 [Kineosphaera limosa NBRC 100340]
MSGSQPSERSLGTVRPREHHDPRRRVTLVTAPACHLCEDAYTLLTERAEQGLLQLTVVEMQSPQGESLIARHRPPLFPMVLLDDRLLSCGRLSRGKLDRVLESPV